MTGSSRNPRSQIPLLLVGAAFVGALANAETRWDGSLEGAPHMKAARRGPSPRAILRELGTLVV